MGAIQYYRTIPDAPPETLPIALLKVDDWDTLMEFTGSSGGYLTAYRAVLNFDTNPWVLPPKDQYRIEIQFSETVQASSVANPSTITGSEYLYNAPVNAVFTIPEGRISAVDEPSLVDLYNDQWRWPDVSGQRYRTLRARLQEVSSGRWTDWYYITAKADPY